MSDGATESMLSDRYIRHDATCPLCASPGLQYRKASCHLHPKAPHWLDQLNWLCCSQCHHIYRLERFTEAGEIWLNDLQPLPNQLATNFDSALRAQWIEPFNLINRVAVGSTMLDFGAGSGAAANAALELGYDVTCVESNEIAKKALEDCGFLTFTSIPNTSYDLIVAADIIEHVANPRTFLDQLKGSLNSNGILFLSTPNPHSALWNRLDGKGKNPYWGELEHLHVFYPQILLPLLEECGFEPRIISLNSRYLCGLDIVCQIGETWEPEN